MTSNARDAALDEAAEAARSCGNGEQELWDPWETGYRFAREDIAKAILALKRRAEPAPDPRDAAMRMARNALFLCSYDMQVHRVFVTSRERAFSTEIYDATISKADAAIDALDAAMKPQESSRD